MKKAAVLTSILAAVFFAGCANLTSSNPPSEVFAQNIIPLNHGVKVFGVDTSTTLSAFISGAKCFFSVREVDGGYAKADTQFYKNATVDSGNESITKLEVLHVECSSIYFEMGAYLPAAEILMIEETSVVQGQHRYLRYVSGYFHNGNFDIVQDTAIVVAMNYGGYYHPYGPYGSSFGEFRSIVLQDGFPGRTVIDASMTSPHKITVVEEYGAGQFPQDSLGSSTACPTSCEHFFRITICSLGESPMPWNQPRPLLEDIKDSLDLGLCSLLVGKAKVAPIDSAYAELQNDDHTVYFYARAGAKIWESFPFNIR